MADEKIMTRVMALLERAEHPGTPPMEANLCREKAEALMAQHTIDRMDLTPEEKSKVVQQDWDIHLSGDNIEFQSHIFSLLREVLTHCGIRINTNVPYARDEDGHINYEIRRAAIVGFPEDVSYAERIWFNVFRTFVENVNPKWDASKSLGNNVYAFIKSGFSWQQVHDFAYAAREDHYGLPPRGTGGGSKLHRAYKEALAERGEEWSVTRRNKAYRASFARSYMSTIGQRLSSMREAAKGVVSDADKYALAVISTAEQVDAEFYRLYPEFDPEVRRKQREAMDFEAAVRFASLPKADQERLIREEAARRKREDAAWRAAQGRGRRNYNAVRNSDRVDPAAWARGQDVASKVNLRNDGEVKKPKKASEIQ